MIDSESKEYKLLYVDDFEEVVGLDEMQLIDPPLEDRVESLSKLLESSNLFVVYQTALLLCAWGKKQGLRKIESLVDEEFVPDDLLSPHRISGEDNAYDEMAYAVHLYRLSEGSQEDTLRLYKKLLSIYHKHFFESKLKHALLKASFQSLVPNVNEAIENTLGTGRVYQASQLLPVMASLDIEKASEWIQRFKVFPKSVPDPAANVAEALGYFQLETNKEQLKVYLESESPGVASAARKSLERLSHNAENV